MNYVTGAIVAIVGVITLVFGIQNLDAVDVSFLVWSTTLPKIVLILGVYLLGMFTGWGLWAMIKSYLAKK